MRNAKKHPTAEQYEEMSILIARQYRAIAEVDQLLRAHQPEKSPACKLSNKVVDRLNALLGALDSHLEEVGESEAERLRLSRLPYPLSEDETPLPTPKPHVKRPRRFSEEDLERLAGLALRLLEDAAELWRLGMKSFPINSKQYGRICSAGEAAQRLHDQIRRDAVDQGGWAQKAWDGKHFSQTAYGFN